MLLHRGGVFRVIADREEAAVDFGVERLDAAVHHFGKAGDLRHIHHRQAEVAQEFGRAAGADQLDAELGHEGFGEIG